jgi:glycosyltransferase involved in cell wall biosynthesis
MTEFAGGSEKPKVTIVVPVYNGANYVEEALHTALNQTYDNIEIVTVNDGSTDNGATHRILTDYATRYPDKIKYIFQENQGVAGALNTAIANMTGDIFTWLSHDDLFELNKIERQVDYYLSLNKRDACLFSDFYLVDPDNNILHTVVLDHKEFVTFPRRPLMRGAISGCTIFIPRHIMVEMGGFELAYRHTQDYRLWRRIVDKYELFHQPELLVRSRQHPSQDSLKHDAVVETEALWADMLFEVTSAERVHLYGSAQRFFKESAKLLQYSPNKRTAMASALKARDVRRTTTVSVIQHWSAEPTALASALSVLSQTHESLELLLACSAGQAPPPEQVLAHATPVDVRIVQADRPGRAAAWNAAADVASGEYVAILEAGDAFTPHKVERQLAAMMQDGSLFSHTSFNVKYAGREPGLGMVRSGQFHGNVYPAILQACPISASTVMLHRSLVDGGLRFDIDPSGQEALLAWAWAAVRYPLLGVDEALSVVRWTETSSPLHVPTTLKEVNYLVDLYRADPLHSRAVRQIDALEDFARRLTDIEYRRKADDHGGDEVNELDQALLASVFGDTV